MSLPDSLAIGVYGQSNDFGVFSQNMAVGTYGWDGGTVVPSQQLVELGEVDSTELLQAAAASSEQLDGVVATTEIAAAAVSSTEALQQSSASTTLVPRETAS